MFVCLFYHIPLMAFLLCQHDPLLVIQCQAENVESRWNTRSGTVWYVSPGLLCFFVPFYVVFVPWSWRHSQPGTEARFIVWIVDTGQQFSFIKYRSDVLVIAFIARQIKCFFPSNGLNLNSFRVWTSFILMEKNEEIGFKNWEVTRWKLWRQRF